MHSMVFSGVLALGIFHALLLAACIFFFFPAFATHSGGGTAAWRAFLPRSQSLESVVADFDLRTGVTHKAIDSTNKL